MANAHELARGHKRLRALIEFAVGEGWHVKRTPGGHLKFTKPGCAAIYTSFIANTEIQVGEEKIDVKDITPEKL
ncbi:hypothetical protein ACQKIS_22930, partial [Pseudomonas fulva]